MGAGSTQHVLRMQLGIHIAKGNQSLQRAALGDCVAGLGAGFTLTALAAGRLLGGALWRITTPDGEDIVYAVRVKPVLEWGSTGHVGRRPRLLCML